MTKPPNNTTTPNASYSLNGLLPYEDKASATNTAFYNVPATLISALTPALQALCHSHEQQVKAVALQNNATTGKRANATQKDLLAAAGGNAAIAAILARHQQRSQVSTTKSYFADYTPTLRALFAAEQSSSHDAHAAITKNNEAKGNQTFAKDDLLEHFFGHNYALNQTIYHLTALSHILGAALNRQVIHCAPRELDDTLFLNTGEIGAKLPQWSLTFDLSACPECAPLTGLIVSRITCKPLTTHPPKNNTKRGSLGGDGGTSLCLASTHTKDPMFCEALGVSISLNQGPFTALNQALLLDSASCMSDMLEGAFNYQESAYCASDPKNMDENSTNTSTNMDTNKINKDFLTNAEDELLSASLRAKTQLQPLLHALKYVFYFLTHQDQLKSGTLNSINGLVTELNNPKQVSSSSKLWERSQIESSLKQIWQHYVL